MKNKLLMCGKTWTSCRLAIARRGCLASLALLACLMLASLPASAQQKQKFSVTSFELDQSSTTGERNDSDGYPMALIKVTSNDPESLTEYVFNFGNQYSVKDSRNHGDEMWLFVQRNAKRVTISHGNTSVEFELRPMVEAGKVYHMYIKGPERVMRMQMVRFDIIPKEQVAVVFVKGSGSDATEFLFGTTGADGSVAKNLKCDQYTYRVISEYYKESNGSFVLNGDSKTHTERVALRANLIDVTLVVDADADIFINNEKKGTHTWTGLLAPDDYLVECRQANHVATSKIITVMAGAQQTIMLDQPQPILGCVSVNSTPLDATITIDGRDYGTTPRNIDIVIGKHNIVVAKKDYQSFTQAIDVDEYEMIEVMANLEVSANKSSTSQSIKKGNIFGATGKINGHEYIDLGLPSGLLWATCNVGASKPEENGDYYAWGETVTKNDYSSSTSTAYGRTTGLLKSIGIIGSGDNLTLAYDAANKAWGGTWRMPTFVEIQELINNTNITWTMQNGKYGRKIVSKNNGNSIFLPASGYCDGTSFHNDGLYGFYWSSSPSVSDIKDGYSLGFNSNDFDWCYDNRYYGQSVRPVSKPK